VTAPEPLLDSITRLLRYQRSPENATAAFRKLKHDADLLPKLQQQLEIFLAAHGKFREVIYDTQGIRDDGTDMVLRIPSVSGDSEPRLICFQVKSFSDLEAEGYMKDLKAQRDDTLRRVQGLEHYFLLLCTDMKIHKRKVRNIMAEFRSATWPEVIEPAFAFTFLHHSATRIDAYVKRTIEANDLVFQRALREIGHYESPSAQALIIYITVEAVLTGKMEFDVAALQADTILRAIYTEVREKQEAMLDDARSSEISFSELDEHGSFDRHDEGDDDADEEVDEPIQILDFEEQLVIDLETIDTGILTQAASGQAICLLSDQTRSLNAVIMDALARYEYSRSQLMDYMFDAMGTRV
jgi:hypothetical protein